MSQGIEEGPPKKQNRKTPRTPIEKTSKSNRKKGTENMNDNKKQKRKKTMDG